MNDIMKHGEITMEATTIITLYLSSNYLNLY